MSLCLSLGLSPSRSLALGSRCRASARNAFPGCFRWRASSGRFRAEAADAAFRLARLSVFRLLQLASVSLASPVGKGSPRPRLVQLRFRTLTVFFFASGIPTFLTLPTLRPAMHGAFARSRKENRRTILLASICAQSTGLCFAPAPCPAWPLHHAVAASPSSVAHRCPHGARASVGTRATDGGRR